MNAFRSMAAIALAACISGLVLASPARAQETDAQRRLDALEAEDARLRRDLREAARHLREAADALDHAASARAEPSPGEAPAPSTPETDAEPDYSRYDPLLRPLAMAHHARDDAKVAEAEKAVIAKGAAVRPIVEAAFEREKYFNVKVSLEYILLAIDGKAVARDLIAFMEKTKDPGEKMRLAFMLQKVPMPGEVIAEMLQSETDPMIKKYIIRSCAISPDGLAVLQKIAKADEDRNLRIEAIRALEERGATTTATFLMDLATHEQDASVKAIAVRALASTAGHEAFDFFKTMLDASERTNNRAEAARYFERAGTKEDLATLRVLYDAEKVYYIKQKLKQAIDAIDKREGLPEEPK